VPRPHQVVSKQSDVYMFGIFLWECFSGGRQPYGRALDHEEAARRVKLENLRPSLDPSWPAEYGELMEQCWHSDPAQRPDMQSVCKRLNQLAMPSFFFRTSRKASVDSHGHVAERSKPSIFGRAPVSFHQTTLGRPSVCHFLVGEGTDVTRSQLSQESLPRSISAGNGWASHISTFVMHPPRGKGSEELWSQQQFKRSEELQFWG